MLLHDARRGARLGADGEIVLLEDQDRAKWDHPMIEEGLALVERALRRPGPPSPYAIQAAIAALHARTRDGTPADWRQIAGLYAVLLRLAPTPVIELNHGVAVAMADGPARGLDLLDSLDASGALDGYALLQSARGELLRRLGRIDAARVAYRRAIDLARVDPERRLYERRLRDLGSLFRRHELN